MTTSPVFHVRFASTTLSSLLPSFFPNASSSASAAAVTVEFSLVGLFATLSVLGTIILATIVGNAFVVAAVVLERNLRNVANYLVASLAIADLLVAALVMPLAAVNEVRALALEGNGHHI